MMIKWQKVKCTYEFKLRCIISGSTMIKSYSAVFLMFLILSCKDYNNKDSYEIPVLEENIKAFINSKKCFSNSYNIVNVNLNVNHDTLSVGMHNTYPRVTAAKFNYDTMLYGHRIIFTGERIKGYCKRFKVNQYPPDIISESKNREWPYIEEFTSWLFLYKHGKLIYKSLACE